MHIKRLRIFAVSNGSGKSVLYKYLLSQHYFNKYFYINADDITKGLSNGFSFSNWPVEISEDSFYKYLETSSFNTILNSADLKKTLSINDSVFMWNGKNENLTYVSAFIADYLRNQFLYSDSSFSCETVFSHPSKIDFIKLAKHHGFKIYLYFIATRNPVINLDRVANRVQSGGHDVPSEKISSRYYRCLDNLYEAIKCSDKVFLFDNSEAKTGLSYNNFAEIMNGECRIINL
ncbi:MAG: hypothetical protein IJP62_10700 [Treponema sp.]|nr:hypothetical protein [Treponema sp.]